MSVVFLSLLLISELVQRAAVMNFMVHLSIFKILKIFKLLKQHSANSHD